jgi:hypothetical protein
MYSSHITKVPASWAQDPSASAEEAANGTETNGHTNGGTNGAGGGGADVIVPESFLNGRAVRTVYGLVPLKHALDWPVFASYDELAGCAAWMGGRIPTFEEARSVYTYAEGLKKKQAENQLGKTVPAVNG